MIPRLLVPEGAKPPAADAVSTRRRPTALDDRKLVPSTLPIVPLDGRSTIPSSLPLESIAARVVVPRDVKPSEFVREEKEDLPLQPTDLDERVIVPQGAAPPEVIEPIHNIPTDLVETDVFMTGEVNLLNKETPAKDRAELVKSVMSFAAHILFIAFLIFEPKIFPPHAPTQEENELARRQMTILLPPGALDELKTPPRPRQPPVHVDPKVLRRVAPPVPKPEAVPAPTPVPKQPEKPKELPSAPTPQPQQLPPKAQDESAAKQDAPKQPLKLETPQQQPTKDALLLPKNSLGGSLRDSIRESSRMNAPTALGGGGQVPSNSGLPGAGGQAQAYGNMEMLTPTEGVDFNDYLHRVYIIVKRNWFSVMPESVRLGDKGVVSLQFRIMKNGVVPDGEPVRLSTSGKEPLDRAAVSSIRASSPFEPLPPAFSGPYIELRFTYFYNLQPNYGQ
ncbi:MAG: TonB C-terminal domain-containing protein [Acidobacteria bacterium]|nr:TonB C-terminal domain-containing protein [Acidobacteriota bacterium]